MESVAQVISAQFNSKLWIITVLLYCFLSIVTAFSMTVFVKSNEDIRKLLSSVLMVFQLAAIGATSYIRKKTTVFSLSDLDGSTQVDMSVWSIITIAICALLPLSAIAYQFYALFKRRKMVADLSALIGCLGSTLAANLAFSIISITPIAVLVDICSTDKTIIWNFQLSSVDCKIIFTYSLIFAIYFALAKLARKLERKQLINIRQQQNDCQV